ncbi:hypothetical protein [Cerasicoccus arenae]|uniref:Uncharacterized protein n=1 Tax=Cerasicoccus arenae TaxID=424488 RepID=A0A8J3GEU6_9BACT|nr:hypothetical protein [Cerasicoccus arenae]MBK1857777.1 hypothetical protein [Cerasicoccus arenae]GHC11998.1 hypothetical protein GCM10007047_31730 [Cerasicoccus arenae]
MSGHKVQFSLTDDGEIESVEISSQYYEQLRAAAGESTTVSLQPKAFERLTSAAGVPVLLHQLEAEFKKKLKVEEEEALRQLTKKPIGPATIDHILGSSLKEKRQYIDPGEQWMRRKKRRKTDCTGNQFEVRFEGPVAGNDSDLPSTGSHADQVRKKEGKIIRYNNRRRHS